MSNLNVFYYLSKLIKKIHIPAIKNTHVHSTSKICSESQVVDTNIDRYSYIGNKCTIINTSIGSFTSIADNCIIGGASHPIEWVSTSPVFHEGKNILKKNFSNHNYNPYKSTTIGNDVWIGNNVLIKSGVTIGNGSIIGMGSVVTKDIGDYEIWAGNPAKIIRYRFDEKTIHHLLELRWWEMSEKKIESISRNYNSVSSLLESIDKE